MVNTSAAEPGLPEALAPTKNTSNMRNDTAHVSALSAALSGELQTPTDEAELPFPANLVVPNGNDGAAGRAQRRQRAATSHPPSVLLRIDATDQGFVSAGSSPQTSSFTYQAPPTGVHGGNGHAEPAPVQVTARLAPLHNYSATHPPQPPAAAQQHRSGPSRRPAALAFGQQRSLSPPEKQPQHHRRQQQYSPRESYVPAMVSVYPTAPYPGAPSGISPVQQGQQAPYYMAQMAQMAHPPTHTLMAYQVPHHYPNMQYAAVALPGQGSHDASLLEAGAAGQYSVDGSQQYVYHVQYPSAGAAAAAYMQNVGISLQPDLPRRRHHLERLSGDARRYSNNSSSGGGSRQFSRSSSLDALPGVREGPQATLFQNAIKEAAALGSSDRAEPPAPPPALVERLRAMKDSEGAETALEELQGYLVALSRDQTGSRVVQGVLDGAGTEGAELVLQELRPWLEILIADQFGNYVIQRLLDARSDAVARGVWVALRGRVLPFSLHLYGCRVVQKALEVLPLEDRIALCQELEPFTLHCVADQNANHVIQKCLETVQPSDGVAGMLEAIAEHSLTLAKHSFGCRLVQRLLQHCTLPGPRAAVAADALTIILELTQNQYGNYVIQHLVTKGPNDARNAILAEILPLTATLSCHKFASNVIESCLQHCTAPQRASLIQELLKPSDQAAPRLHTLARDQFGNYVLQRALDVADPADRAALMEELTPYLEAMRHGGYGKHIATRVAKLNGTASAAAAAAPEGFGGAE